VGLFSGNGEIAFVGGFFAQKRTGLRCGGRGKSDIFSALSKCVYTVISETGVNCSYSKPCYYGHNIAYVQERFRMRLPPLGV